MQSELSIRISAPRERVWQALHGDLAASGSHVEVLESREPESLTVVARTSPGEQMTLGYVLAAEGDATVVSATIAVVGFLYSAKRLFSFGSIDRAYERLLAVGLDNLSEHFGGKT